MKFAILVMGLLMVSTPQANARDDLTLGPEVHEYAASAHEVIYSKYADLGKLMGWGDGKATRPSTIEIDGNVAYRISTELLAAQSAILRFQAVASLLIECNCPEGRGCVSLVGTIIELRRSRDWILGDLKYIHNHSLSVLANDAVKHLGEIAETLEDGISGHPCPKQFVDSMVTHWEQHPSGSD